jgi:hypothetical protein
MEFRGGKGQRQEILTYQQATLICNEAQRRRLSSIALAQAMQTECGLRQKDLIGEWVPRSATGVTDISWGPSKWLMGARWEEVDENFIWRHRLSKSAKGNQAIMNADLGKVEEYDLRAFPLVVAQLQRTGAVVDLRRADFPASGPMIICVPDDRGGIPSFAPAGGRSPGLAEFRMQSRIATADPVPRPRPSSPVSAGRCNACSAIPGPRLPKSTSAAGVRFEARSLN